MDIVKAISCRRHTLVGYSGGKAPFSMGNCFSVEVEADDETWEVKIVNFVYENLQDLIARRILDWPISVALIDVKTGVFHDSRIPETYYQNSFCEVCCPRTLLPITQQLSLDRRDWRRNSRTSQVR